MRIMPPATVPFPAWILGVCLAGAAVPAAAVSLGSVPLPPDTRAVEVILERGRKELLEEKYAEAGKSFAEAMRNPEFTRLTKGRQFRTLVLASEAARGREDWLEAHEYIAIACDYPDAGAAEWAMRARLAGWVEAWSDAGLAIKTIAQQWPEALGNFHHEMVQSTLMHMDRDKKLAAERLEVLNALFDAKFTLEWHVEPSGLWRELVLQALERKDLPRAREILRRIDDAGSLVRMRIDKRFDSLVQAEPAAFDVARAADSESRKMRRVMNEHPTRLDPVVQYMYTLFTLGEYAEIISLADRVLERNAKATPDKPVYEDVADTLNWVFDLKSQALRGLGRWDDSLAIQEEARRLRETSSDKVSQAINLGSSYLLRNRPEDALESLEGIDWSRDLSGYGRMQLQHVRLRACLQQGNRKEAEEIYAYLRENRVDAPDTWQEAMLDWGDLDGAAASYIARLRDPEERTAALYAAQTFQPVPRLPREIEGIERWKKLLARPDVAATLLEVGRRETQPIFDLWN
jgi:tetratricopeptide (TPR) repeat protein